MESAMKTARDGATHRVFQLLPRRMRRRAASYDIRRIPKSLRAKAKPEYTETSKPQRKHISKRGYSKRLTKTEEFLRRQKDKSWLETHLWHAKRMHMKTLWGYRLAEKPTAKAFRASHRASMHDAILHDASYFGTIELMGPPAILRKLLDTVADPHGVSPAAARFTGGGRVCDTLLYAPRAYPHGLIAPVTTMWRPAPLDATIRTIWVRVHPAAFDEVWAALTTAAGYALEGTQGQTVELADLRDELVSFELVGPKGSRVLKGALQPTSTSSEREDFDTFWNYLADLPNAGAIPRGMVVGFDAVDPRVTYPPKNAKPGDLDARDDEPMIWPSGKLAQSGLWDAQTREGVRVPRYRKRDLDERRGKNLIPGTPLERQDDDAKVPLILVQRTLGETMHGWLLIAPRGWGTALLHSLTFTGTRVAGLAQRATQHAEAGASFFPVDFPSTKACGAWWATRGAEERARWERKPKAKRVSYEKRGVRSAWVPDWDVVLGLEGAGARADESEAQRGERAERKIWLLPGDGIEAALEAGAGAVETLVTESRAKRSLPPIPIADSDATDLIQTALVSVRVHLVGRGAPGDVGLIYFVKDEERNEWERGLEADKNDSMDIDAPDLTELGKVIPPPEDIIGYLSSGSYSLTRGRGFGVGAVSASKLAQILKYDTTSKTRYKCLVKVRDRDGMLCRAATLEIMP
ncbi:POP1-domain-containing protein [Exidia glandulosa HHB12029]|uniref:POP1-domain-containing protein n=1 Tax=Exidia glandulosa HHB12029 TaxID=1314781 RepID=A0A166BEU0_EXIGL|nr:POP1-domain-containing protein [Exidia glandulosa HHB12029]